MHNPLNILFISHRIPYPPNKGDKIRSYAIISALRSLGHDVSLAFLVDDPEDMQYTSFLAREFSHIAFEPLTKIDRYKNLVKAGLSKKSLSIAHHFHPKLKEKIDTLISSGKFDLIYYFSGASLNYYTEDKSKKIIDFVDADSCKWEQYAKDYFFPANQFYKEEARRTAQVEIEFVKKADISLFVSKKEADFFKETYPILSPFYNRITHLNNNVDTEYFSPTFKCNNPYKDIFPTVPYVAVFTGVMDYKPNVEAVEYFVYDIMPEFERETGSQLGFAIVGKNPNKAVKKLNNVQNVFVTGSVPDIRPYILHADVSVNPLFIARGIQNKILEAMACGKTVLASPAAFDGIEKAQPNIDLFICSSKEEWVLKLREALYNESMRKRFGDNARLVMTSHYNKGSMRENLDNILQNIIFQNI